MRFYVGHRLPGGFWAGFSTHARRPHRVVYRAARTTGRVGCIGWIVLAGVVALAFQYWYISVPVLALTAIAVGITVHRRNAQLAERGAAAPAQPAAAARLPATATPVARPAAPPVSHAGELLRLQQDATGVRLVPVTEADLAAPGPHVFYRIRESRGARGVSLERVEMP